MSLRRTTSFALSLGLAAHLAALPTPSANPLNEELALVFADEFEGSTLNSAVWKSPGYEEGLKRETARGPDNLEVRDGELRLHVRKEARPAGRGRSTWTAGFVYLREPLENNSYVEARFKPGQASGVNNAFWLAAMDGSTAGVSDRYEIDIVESRQDVTAPTPTGRAHLAWHDWKTMAYAINASGQRDHVAQGISIKHPFDTYQTWGLWYGEHEMIYYLDGQEVWRGKTHARYHDQWRTGVGKFDRWFPQEEQRAYGRYGQEDWNYLGGYTGDRLNVVFSNLPWEAPWSPLTDSAHGTYMAVDYVRIFRPKRVLETAPEHRALADQPIVLGPGEERVVNLGHGQSLIIGEQFPRYFSFVARVGEGANLQVSLEDLLGSPLLVAGSPDPTAIQVGFAQAVHSSNAFPANQRQQPWHTPGEESIWTLRVSPPIEDMKLWSASLCVFPPNDVPSREPFFYPNIDAQGNTSMNNHWHLNAKGTPSSQQAHAVRFRNAGAGSIEVRELRTGSSFRSVIP
jgi:hypothetical protein